MPHNDTTASLVANYLWTIASTIAAAYVLPVKHPSDRVSTFPRTATQYRHPDAERQTPRCYSITPYSSVSFFSLYLLVSIIFRPLSPEGRPNLKIISLLWPRYTRHQPTTASCTSALHSYLRSFVQMQTALRHPIFRFPHLLPSRFDPDSLLDISTWRRTIQAREPVERPGKDWMNRV